MSPDHRAEPPGLVWWRVPEDELGVAVPDRVVVASSHQFAIIVGEITAYTRGFQVTAGVRVSRSLSVEEREWFVPDITGSSLLRFAIRYADGSETGRERPAIGGVGLSQVAVHQSALSERPTGVHLIPVSASTTAYAGESVYWVFPLSPPGPVTITCEWVSAGVAPASIELDGTAIREGRAPISPAVARLGPAPGCFSHMGSIELLVLVGHPGLRRLDRTLPLDDTRPV